VAAPATVRDDQTWCNSGAYDPLILAFRRRLNGRTCLPGAHDGDAAAREGDLARLEARRPQLRCAPPGPVTRSGGEPRQPRRQELLFEEVPQAYKDIETVVNDLVTAGLARVASLAPLVTYKVRAR
jgi:hypothetical protein